MAKVIYYSDELQHHGILGQKWGYRRYQNEDGSLTAEGRIRYRDDGTKRSSSERKRLEKSVKAEILSGRKKTREEAIDEVLSKQKPRKKISDMSDEELKQYITRKIDEKTALGLEKDIAGLTPKQISTGQKIVEKLLNDVLIPSAKQGLGNALSDFAKKYTKEQDPDAVAKKNSEKLKRVADDWKNKANIEESKNRYYKNLNKNEDSDNSSKDKKSSSNQEKPKEQTSEKVKAEWVNEPKGAKGVKGMRWGVRSEDEPIDADFTVKNSSYKDFTNESTVNAGKEYVGTLLPTLYKKED